MLMREADAKSSFKGKHIVLLIVAAILVAITAFLNRIRQRDPITTLTILNAIGLFFAGWMASMAMPLLELVDRLFY